MKGWLTCKDVLACGAGKICEGIIVIAVGMNTAPVMGAQRTDWTLGNGKAMGRGSVIQGEWEKLHMKYFIEKRTAWSMAGPRYWKFLKEMWKTVTKLAWRLQRNDYFPILKN